MSECWCDHEDERYPGEPLPVDMLFELQAAIDGVSHATASSPGDEWAHLIAAVYALKQQADAQLALCITIARMRQDAYDVSTNLDEMNHRAIQSRMQDIMERAESVWSRPVQGADLMPKLPEMCLSCAQPITERQCICCVRGRWGGEPALYAHCEHVNDALVKLYPQEVRSTVLSSSSDVTESVTNRYEKGTAESIKNRQDRLRPHPWATDYVVPGCHE